MKKNTIIKSCFCLSIALAAGCNDITEIETGNGPSGINNEIRKINISAENFSNADNSRIIFGIDKDGATFTWSKNDTIGIFPQNGGQVIFPMISAAGTSSAVFDGEGWNLKSSARYAAYYPVMDNILLNPKMIPVSYNDQYQNGNRVLMQIKDHDYLKAVSAVNKSDSISFNFTHLGCLVQLNITTAAPTEINSVTLQAQDNAFTTTGYIDMTSDALEIIPTSKADQITIPLQNMKTESAGEIVSVHFMLPPTDLSKQEIYVEISDKKDLPRRITIPGRKFEANKFYVLNVDEKDVAVPKIVTVKTPGTLEEAIKDAGIDKNRIRSLIIKGQLDGNDLIVLRAMAGANIDGTYNESGKLEEIDLRYAQMIRSNPDIIFGKRSDGHIDSKVLQNNSFPPGLFDHCKNLKTVKLPQYIGGYTWNEGEDAFNACTNLVSVSLPLNLKALNKDIFKNCTALEYITIPQSVNYFNFGAFSGCENLKGVNIPDNGLFESLPQGVFENCKSLETINIPQTVRLIGIKTFAGCENLKEIILPRSLTNFGPGGESFMGCKGLKKVTIPENVRKFSPGIFRNCENLEEIELHDYITDLSIDVFEGTNIDSLYIPKGITDIRRECFDGTSAMKKLTLSSNIQNISDMPDSIEMVYCHALIPPKMEQDAINKETVKAIYVPEKSVTAYKLAAGWNAYSDKIQAFVEK